MTTTFIVLTSIVFVIVAGLVALSLTRRFVTELLTAQRVAAHEAHADAMAAFSRVATSVQEENRATLRELTDLVHGPAQPPDADLDYPDPTTEMNGPWGVNADEMIFRDPTDDALPDEELVARGPTRAVMESDIAINTDPLTR